MSRLLFIIAVAAVIYWLLKSYRERLPGEGGANRDVAEDMVRCAHCGVHFPKSEGVAAEGKYFCSDAHRQASSSAPRRD